MFFAIVFFVCLFCWLIDGLIFIEKLLDRFILKKNIKHGSQIAKLILDGATIAVFLILLLTIVAIIVII